MTRVDLPHRDRKPKIEIGVPLFDGALERDLETYVRLHLAMLPWCRFWVNKERYIQGDHGAGFVPGLAEGSCDLIGIVRRGDTMGAALGIFCGIELKQPKAGKKPKPEQLEWMATAERMGAVVGWTDSLFGALEIVARARGTEPKFVAAEIAVRAGRVVVA